MCYDASKENTYRDPRKLTQKIVRNKQQLIFICGHKK